MEDIIMAFSDNYFKSKDIKVFPSSFRGTYEVAGGSALVFDPEARLNTESNYTCPKTTSGKDTYIVSGDTTSIKFVLGGYYFELNDLSSYKEKLTGKYIGIKLREVILKNSGDGDSDTTRITYVLDSWESTSVNILDFEDKNEENVYYFSGLKFGTLADLTGVSAQIKLLDDQGNLNKTYLIPNLQHSTGENTLLHGEGLKAASKNQTVFGKYNDNKSDTLFEIGIGTTEDGLDDEGKITQKNRKNALEVYADKAVINTAFSVTGETTVTNNLKISSTKTVSEKPLEITDSTTSNSVDTGALTVVGGIGISESLNVGGNTNLGNKLIIKTAPDEDETNVKIEGTLNVTGKTNICSNITIEPTKTTLEKPVKIADTSNAALVVSGKTTVKKDLEVGDTTKVLVVKNDPTDDEQNVTITGTSKSTGKATFEKGLEVASGQTTTLGGQVDVTGAVNITGDATINGKTSITGAVNIIGKATSNSTTSTDGSTTLTTKDYVDNFWKLSDVSIKNVLLNALYPIGSIYTSTSLPQNSSDCPIKLTLGGTWERIKDTFLYAAADGVEVDGESHGSNDATLVKHKHEVTVGEHNSQELPKGDKLTINSPEINGWFAMRTINRDGESPILAVDGSVFNYDTSYSSTDENYRKIDTIGATKTGHTKVTFSTTPSHEIAMKLTHVVTEKEQGEDDGTGRNMPKHMYVYMWKRVEDKIVDKN